MTAVGEGVAAGQDGPVLIVDDMAELRGLLAGLLEDAGFTTITAGNGREACRLLSEGVSPCVVLLDVRMPVMDGWEFLRTARPTVPVILMSGTVVDPPPPLPHCVVAILEKPLRPDVLFDALRVARNDRCREAARPQSPAAEYLSDPQKARAFDER